jgi:lambda repressor-like predicted transcriptional regulator
MAEKTNMQWEDSMGSGANRLRDLRREHGLALWGLAARTGVSASTLSAIERWDYMPTPPVRQRIADALGIEVSVIWPEGGPAGQII